MNLRFLAPLTFALAGLISIAVPCSAQDQPQDERSKMQEKAIEQAVEQLAEQWKTEYGSKFEIQIGELADTCELTDEQLKKLQFGAKGAVSKSTKKIKKVIQNVLIEYGDEFSMPLQFIDPNEAEAANNSDESVGSPAGADEGTDETIMIANGSPLLEMFGIELAEFESVVGQDPENEPIWKKAIAKVLTDEQKKQYADAVAKRKVRQRDACVRGFLARADLEMILSEKQLNRMVEWVNKNYGKDLVLHGGDADLLYMYEVDSRPSEKSNGAAKILSPAQLVIWTKKYQKQLDALELVKEEIKMMREEYNDILNRN